MTNFKILLYFNTFTPKKGKGGFTSPVKPFYDHNNLAKAALPHGFRETFYEVINRGEASILK